MPMNTNAGGRDPGWYDQGEMTLNVNREKKKNVVTQNAWMGMCNGSESQTKEKMIAALDAK